jgi:formylglycine-generating enzyme
MQSGERHMLGPASSSLHLPSVGAGGQLLTLRTDALECVVTEMGRPAWASEWGTDRYGLFADIVIAGVTQRMRWISPGCFLMGSPPEESDRSGDEGPQHEVTLTQGFWLADTACTRALWTAVTGRETGGSIDDSDLPVKTVSWNEVNQNFLLAMNRKIGQNMAFLLSEAQWEYACRSGTMMAYCFGDTITTDQVNFDGYRPPPEKEAGIYRKRPIPVKALPANMWGLYQMHGNVLEWCADARRKYTVESVIDPFGGQDETYVMLRGGSWQYLAKTTRSAHRSIRRREDRNDRIGFRFALRSFDLDRQEVGGLGRATIAAVSQMELGAEISGGDSAELEPRKKGLGSRILSAVGNFFRKS